MTPDAAEPRTGGAEPGFQPQPTHGETSPMNRSPHPIEPTGPVASHPLRVAGEPQPRKETTTMSYTTDNRWSPGASGATVPDTAPAAYSARWIDQGDSVPADVVPDRQGFAYNDKADYERLITLMGQQGDALRVLADVPRDETHWCVEMDAWQCYMRRAGGYVYVDAWLEPPRVVGPDVPDLSMFEDEGEDEPSSDRACFYGLTIVVTERADRTWQVLCEDGEHRHTTNFRTLTEAWMWADTGHACMKHHTYVEVWA